MAAKISPEDSQQLLQTVEMFEAIAESQPDDYQSLEILKEAYAKLGRAEESLSTSKRLAKAYVNVGQVSLALLEYEGIAQECPDDPEIKAALVDLESKVTPTESAVLLAPSLAEHSKPTPPAGGSAGAPSLSSIKTRPEEGDHALINILTAEKIVTPQAMDPILARLREMRIEHADKTIPLSLLPLIANEQLARLEDLMAVIVEKSRLPYLPLSIYDADGAAAKLLPEDVCYQHCVTAFDSISRSLLIATSNPFDIAARKQIEATVKRHVFWYISPPADIIIAYRRCMGLDRQRGGPAKP